MIATSKGDTAFAKLRVEAELSEQEANVIMFLLAVCPLGETHMGSFLTPHHCFLILSEPETHLLALATGKACIIHLAMWRMRSIRIRDT